MKLHTNIINIATFWIPIPSARRSIRTFLKGETNCIRVQNFLINRYSKDIKSLIVILVPEYNAISGGIQSMFSIAKTSEKYANIHKSEVILMTRPNEKNTTIVFNTKFKNKEVVFRFKQLLYFDNLENLIIHIPEESCANFYDILTKEEKEFLLNIKNLQINIMNQNIDLMPDKETFKNLYKLTNNITQTVAHHQYCSQEIANKYELPTKLIPPYTDLSSYAVPSYTEKENLILYSPDETKSKSDILKKIFDRLPAYKLLEIKNITLDQYIELVQKAKFMITFGEGYDGYFAQSMLMNGIAFSVYNNKFFPANFDFNKPNIFSSYEDMENNIVDIIKYFENNSNVREETIQHFNAIQNELYSQEIYINCLRNFYLKQYDFFPDCKKIHNNGDQNATNNF